MEETKIESDYSVIAKINNALPVIIILVSIFEMLRISFYYWLFNINILQYLAFTEVLPFMVKDFLIIIGYIFIQFAFVGIKTNSGGISIQNNNQNYAEKYLKIARETKNIPRKIFAYLRSQVWIIGYAILMLLAYVLYLLKVYDFIILMMILTSIISTLIIFLIPYLIIFCLKKQSIIINNITSSLIYAIVILITYGFWRGGDDYMKARYKHVYSGSYIVFEGKNIISNNNYYYIGRTKSSLFFYNEKNNTTDIFSASNVSKISLTHE